MSRDRRRVQVCNSFSPSLPPPLLPPTYESNNSVIVSSADYVAFVRASHRQACWSQGCPQCRIWTSIKIDPHISQPKTDGCWITVELSRMPSREIYTSKKTSWQHFCSGKITQQCICSIFQSVLTLQALLRCKCFEITSLIRKKTHDIESNLQWGSNITEPGNVSISQHVLWVQTVQNDQKHIVSNSTESLWKPRRRCVCVHLFACFAP